jgi:hypothetical protein
MFRIRGEKIKREYPLNISGISRVESTSAGGMLSGDGDTPGKTDEAPDIIAVAFIEG